MQGAKNRYKKWLPWTVFLFKTFLINVFFYCLEIYGTTYTLINNMQAELLNSSTQPMTLRHNHYLREHLSASSAVRCDRMFCLAARSPCWTPSGWRKRRTEGKSENFVTGVPGSLQSVIKHLVEGKESLNRILPRSQQDGSPVVRPIQRRPWMIIFSCTACNNPLSWSCCCTKHPAITPRYWNARTSVRPPTCKLNSFEKSFL